jgi:predicted TIM-barrel fold metal-dependent hydrolase
MTGPIFDAHAHIQPWKMLRPEARALLARGWDAGRTQRVMEDPRALAEMLDREGVERLVAINYVAPDVMGFTDGVNEFVLDIARRTDGRVIPVGSVHPRWTPRPVRRLERLLRAGLRGVKVHPSHQCFFPNDYRRGDRTLAALYRRMEREGTILYVHTGTSIFPGARNVYADPIYVDDVAVDFPRLRIVLAHGGRPLWMETCRFLLRRHPNVWMDVSSVPPKRLLDYFPWIAEVAERVLFGSDWPAPGVPGIRANAEAIDALPLPAETRDAILRANARRLYGM